MPTAPPQKAPGAGDPPPAESEAAPRAALDAFRVRLPPVREGEPPFEGPLDLLLHLVQEHQVDLFDIPIARITEAYLATLAAMRELDIDVAGEFLHMAAQLLLMKSRMLLPRTEVPQDAEAEEPAGDPRAELVRRLLEYQKYRAAAEELARHDILDREVFVRRGRAERLPAAEGPEGLADVSVFKLIEALDRAIQQARPELGREIAGDRLNITDAIQRVAEVLKARGRVSFAELLGGPDGQQGRSAIIATFLALLEMARLRLLRVFQAPADLAGAGAEIVVEASESLGEGPARPAAEDYR
jgi:segregation and condensation protein A